MLRSQDISFGNSFGKTIILQNLLVRVMSQFLITCINPTLLFRMYLKGMFALSCRSWEVLPFEFKISFKRYTLIKWRLAI